MRLYYFCYFLCFFINIIIGKKQISIVTNHPTCTHIGKSIAIKGGSFVDIAISSMICEGVVYPQDSGIGGGLIGVIKFKNNVYMINAREKVPQKIKHVKQIINMNHTIGIPGVIKGYQLLHKRWGKLSWQKLFEPTIKLCLETFKPSYHLRHAIIITNFYKILNHGKIYNPQLCNSLIQISKYGADYFYNNISLSIVKDLKKYNPYIHVNDFKNYDSYFTTPEHLQFTKKRIKYDMYSTAYPGAGKYILKNLIKMIKHKKINLFTIIKKFYKENNLYRYFKYTKKPITSTTNLSGNIHGTSNICVQENNNGLCITSTINHYFGSKFFSKSTGIILNDQLNDLPDYYTKINSNTRPVSSISTSIILKNKKLYLILGGTGGDRIPAGILNVLYYVFNKNQKLNLSVSNYRVYYYKTFEIEKCNLKNINCKNFHSFINPYIKKITNPSNIQETPSYNTVTGIQTINKKNIQAVYDPRRGGLGITFSL